MVAVCNVICCLRSAFPVAGYVNMNQLAHMAMQHQQELSQKKEQTESSDEKTDDEESVVQKFSSASAEQLRASKVGCFVSFLAL